MLCPLTPENAVVIRTRLPWLNPVPLGRQTSFGYGDRLGLATPGHIQAVRRAVKIRPTPPFMPNNRCEKTPAPDERVNKYTKRPARYERGVFYLACIKSLVWATSRH